MMLGEHVVDMNKASGIDRIYKIVEKGLVIEYNEKMRGEK